MKYRILSLLAFAGMLFSSCVKETLPAEGGSILALMENDDTRTSVTDEGVFTWSTGDEIWLHTEAGSIVGTLSSGAGTSSANFSYGASFGDMTGKAVYPYNSGHAISDDVLSVVMPSSYDLGSNLTNTNAAMYGVVSDGRLKFNHLAGVMRFKFKNVPAGVNRFTITLDKKINGTFTADLTETYPVIKASVASAASEKTITLNFDALTETSDISLYVPLPLGTYNTLELGLYAGNQSVWTHSNKVTNTIDRKTLKLMPVVLLGGSIGGDIEGGDSVDGETGENDSVGGDTDAGAGENDVICGPVTMAIDNITATTVTFKGKINVADADKDFSKVTIRYSEQGGFNAVDESLPKVVCTSFDNNNEFSIVLTNLQNNTTYKYCAISKVRTNETYSDKVMSFTTESLSVSVSAKESTIISATPVAEFTGVVVGLSAKDKSDIEVGVAYYTTSAGLKTSSSTKVAATSISSDGVFEVSSNQLSQDTKYYYCSYVKQNSKYVYGTEINELQTINPYRAPSDLNVSSATDLSSPASANCYIVPQKGLYKFKTVKGNSTESVGNVASASILWETFGTSITPEYFDLIKAFCYKDGYIAFQTADTYKEGNAVIAAKDASGTILWSWHIWLTDQPQGQEYYNNAGTMMDRNLGATSATPGDVGALGLLYQWGRKDPFLSGGSISSSTVAKSTITWPSAVSSDSSNGTIEYATANPTTFISYNGSNYDWYYTGDSSTDNTRWTTSGKEKSVYDPCPSGWRVPDGGDNGVWSKALGSSSSFTDELLYDSTYKGMNFSGKFGSDQTIWYPASGFLACYDDFLSNVGGNGHYWSASPPYNYYSYYAYSLSINNSGYVYPAIISYLATGYSVRCLQE